MKALITGVTGQDGSYMAELLLSEGYEVHGLVRRNSIPTTKFIEPLMGNPNFHTHEGDLADTPSLYRLIAELKPDELYNFGAMAGVHPSFHQAAYTIQVGGLSVVQMLEAIRTCSPKTRFLNVASSQIFAGSPDFPQTEETAICPVSPYGMAKALSHMAAKYYRETYGLFVASVIPYAHASPRYSYSFVHSKIIHAIWDILDGKADSLELGQTNIPADLGYAKDYVVAYHKALTVDKPDDYIISAGSRHTPDDFIELAFKEAGLDKDKYVRHNDSFNRVTEVKHQIGGDNSKAKRLLGFEPKTSFEELVKIMVHERK